MRQSVYDEAKDLRCLPIDKWCIVVYTIFKVKSKETQTWQSEYQPKKPMENM